MMQQPEMRVHLLDEKVVARVVKTSLTHPLRIDPVAAGNAGGVIGITFCPGKCGASMYDGEGREWRRDLATDLDAVVAWHADAVVTLIEDHEFDVLGVIELGAQIRARHIAWHHLPIVDIEPPDARFEAGWLVSSPGLLNTLRGGGKVLVHCRGGRGRAGTVAARLLIDLGVPVEDAIARVRKARPGAIENCRQEKYLRALRAQ